MKVHELIEWLSQQDANLDVEVGLRQEYQERLDGDSCQVVSWQGQRFVLLGEPADTWDEADGQPDEAQEWESFDPDC